MKKIVSAVILCFAILFSTDIFSQGIFNKIKEKVKQRADQKTDQAIDKGLDKTEEAAKGGGDTKTKEKTKTKTSQEENSSSGNTSASTNESAPETLQAYQNYDFVAGDKIIFADDFTADQLGEFPSHWGLIVGQGAVNKSGNRLAFNILNGNYAKVKPLMKTKEYLQDAFTVEFDYFAISGSNCGYGMFVWLVDQEGNDLKGIQIGRYKKAATTYFANSPGINELEGTASKLSDQSFYNHWHHIALAYKKPQLKVYIDQGRSLVVPNTGFSPKSLEFGGSAGEEDCPISIANVRVANGGSQNMLNSIFSNGNKFITHGITFDIDKATINPKSMGVLNQVSGYLKENTSVKFEIDGHTDNSGNAAHNLTLSQQRAEAVKAQLINMGIDASRLTSKGFGSTKPLGTNDTPEGKANNRRVEFVKM